MLVDGGAFMLPLTNEGSTDLSISCLDFYFSEKWLTTPLFMILIW
jgi:hypothetical protein